MCEPTSIAIASLVISSAGVGLNAHAQNQASKANKREAKRAFKQTYADLSARAVEERIAAAAEENAANRQAASAVSLARVSAAESGVAGQSADAIANTIEGDRGRYVTAVKQNLGSTLTQIERAKAGQLSLQQSRINSVQPANPFLAGLQIAGLGLDAYSTYLGQRTPKGGGG